MKNKFLMMLTVVVAMLSSSCKKEEVEKRGCLIADAKNYCATCNKDDGSCEYEGAAVFWWDRATSEDLIDGESYSVKFYVDGQLIGSSGTNVYWNAAPTCNSTTAVSFTRSLGKSTSKTFNYRVVDQDGYEYFNTSITLTANTCLQMKLQ